MTELEQAVALLERGENAKAIAAFSRLSVVLANAIAAGDADPETPRALAVCANGLGVALFASGRTEEALGAFRRAMALDPGYTQAALNAGRALRTAGRFAEARATLEAAVTRDPHDAALQNEWGLALAGLLRERDAAAAFDAAIALDDGLADAYFNRGTVLAALGELERARASFRRAVDLAPGQARYYGDWARLRDGGDGDLEREQRLEILARADLPPAEAAAAHFALAQCYESQERFGDAFVQLLAGNRAKRSILPYDETGQLQLMERVAAAFSAEQMRELAADATYAAPIFIIGMPRSGTTLIEQILARHAAVRPLGERADFRFEMARQAAARGTAYPEGAAGWPAAVWGEVARGYLRSVDAQPEERITDKMPANFLFAGAIARAFPRARIVHVRRDPVDTCISCFAQLFTEGNAHTYDMEELARYYRAYERLMKHWHAVLPPGVMLEVRYEEVVADLEGQARRILAHAGLAWDARVLAFHRAEGAVRTASLAQVRQPIYSSSIGKAARYGDAIAPLLAALGRNEA